jgi:formate dehydrogenase assembly factor FdhD
MMATPADLEDLAVGFTLNERIAASPDDIEAVEVLRGKNGIVLRINLTEAPAAAFLGGAPLPRRPERLRIIRSGVARRSRS